MATDIGELRATLTLDGKDYELNLKKASESTKTLDTDTANLATSIFVAQQAYGYAKDALSIYTDAMVGSYQAIKDFNAMTGTSVEEGSKFKGMLESLGLELGDITYSFRSMSNNIQSALNDPNSGAAKSFKQLGVSLVDAQGNIRETKDIFLDTVSALQKMDAGAQRTALGMDTIGKGVYNLNKLLDSGTDAWTLYGQEVAGETEAGMEKFDQFNEAMNKFNKTLDGTKTGIGEGLIPMLTTFVNLLNTYVLPAVNLIGDQLELLGFKLAALASDPMGYLSGKYNKAYFDQVKFLSTATGSKAPTTPQKAPVTGTTTTKENVVRKGLDDEIQANFQSIANYLQSIETKKTLDEDYTADKQKLLELQAEQEILINKSTNQQYKDMWSSLKANIESNPVKAFIDITAGIQLLKGPTSAEPSGGYTDTEWNTGALGSPGSEMYIFMTKARDLGYAYQTALSMWSSGETGDVLKHIAGGTRATGGPVMANSPYLVGERGAEIFVPNTSGTIIPNSNGGMMHVHVDIDGNEVGSAIVDLIRLRTGARF